MIEKSDIIFILYISNGVKNDIYKVIKIIKNVKTTNNPNSCLIVALLSRISNICLELLPRRTSKIYSPGIKESI